MVHQLPRNKRCNTMGIRINPRLRSEERRAAANCVPHGRLPGPSTNPCSCSCRAKLSFFRSKHGEKTACGWRPRSQRENTHFSVSLSLRLSVSLYIYLPVSRCLCLCPPPPPPPLCTIPRTGQAHTQTHARVQRVHVLLDVGVRPLPGLHVPEGLGQPARDHLCVEAHRLCNTDKGERVTWYEINEEYSRFTRRIREQQ